MMAVLIFTACKNDKKTGEKNPTITKENKTGKKEKTSPLSEGKVGNFSIGQKIPGATMRYSMETKTETRAAEGGPVTETYYILYADGKKHLILKPKYDNEDAIGEILVFDKEYQTTEGIGVGSTIEEFMKTYPGYKIWYTYVSDRYIIQNLPAGQAGSKSSVQFILDEKGFTGKKQVKSEVTPLEASDFKENTLIEKIRVYK